MNIGIVGGGPFCKEIIEKTALDYSRESVNARFVAVADPDPDSPGVVIARELKLKTPRDYHELYEAQYDLDLIILLLPEQSVLEDILNTKPANIRVLSCQVFELFWKAIGIEERKSRDRAKEMETILNGIQDSILVITPEREIIEANEPFLSQMGYSREEVIGQKCHEVFQKGSYPCNDGKIVCPLREVIRNKRPSQQILTRVDHNGELRDIEVTIFPIWETDGKILRFIEISRDITDRKKEEKEIRQRLEEMVEERTRQLKETHEKLLHQDKMASLGKLSASVVHEINNPIAGMLNFILLMKRIIEEKDLDQKGITQFAQYLGLMETETRRVSRIASNLLAFSRQSKLELKRVDVNRLVEKTLLLNENLLKISRVRLEKNLEPGLPEIVGSEDQLQQVFMNLISNAAETMDTIGGGVLTIKTTHLLKDKSIMVFFRDSGVGIPDENVSRLFEPFFTTKKKGKGVGLGLSVAYGIVEEHGGTIQIESSLGKGTAFSVLLPVEAHGKARGTT